MRRTEKLKRILVLRDSCVVFNKVMSHGFKRIVIRGPPVADTGRKPRCWRESPKGKMRFANAFFRHSQTVRSRINHRERFQKAFHPKGPEREPSYPNIWESILTKLRNESQQPHSQILPHHAHTFCPQDAFQVSSQTSSECLLLGCYCKLHTQGSGLPGQQSYMQIHY